MADPTPPTAIERQLQAALSGQSPKYYANGIGLAATGTDITIIFLDGAVPAVAVTLAYATAKSLVHDLGEGIKSYEEKTGEKVKLINELMALLQKQK
jgi:hypothetical protein